MKTINKVVYLIIALVLCLNVFTACDIAGLGGEDGRSAYQIWLDNGNSGTQADFLAWLKGAAGDEGKVGSDGLSAYDLFIKYNPDYIGDEEKWVSDLVGGKLGRLSVVFKAEGNEDILRTPLYGHSVTDIPDGPQREHCLFVDWYQVETDPFLAYPLPSELLADFSNVKQDMIVYAGWTLEEHNVTFDYNYAEAPQAPAVQIVKYSKQAVAPQLINRAGYTFGGWFIEKTCENQFSFDTAVGGDLLLYAKWIDDPLHPDTVTVTYMSKTTDNFATYATKTISYGGIAGSDKPADPIAVNYLFGGWYEDAAFTTAFSMSKSLSQNITVYAKMLKKYTFEAEAVEFSLPGYGSIYPESKIMSHGFIKDGTIATVSNGYFVRNLYDKGARLDFEITASEEITDGIMYLRISSEMYQFFGTKNLNGVKYNYLSDTEFKIIVNGIWAANLPDKWLNYGGLYMPMANLTEGAELSKDKTPFEDMLIVSGLNLKKGNNIITLYVDNNNHHGGTFHAEAPIIDCMYIYAGFNLTMRDYQYYTRPDPYVIRD